MEDLYIRPEFQRKGLAKRLVKSLAEVWHLKVYKIKPILFRNRWRKDTLVFDGMFSIGISRLEISIKLYVNTIKIYRLFI